MSATTETRKFFGTILELINSPEAMRALGGFTIRTIVLRTRGEGKGVLTVGGQARKLKNVTPEYAERKRRMKGKHPQAEVGRNSNLTLFGPLLSTLVVKRATKTDVRIGHVSRREGEKAEGQERQGRRFLILSGAEMKEARTFIADFVAKRVR